MNVHLPHLATPATTSTIPPIKLQDIRVHCAACSLHQLCLPMGLAEADMDKLDSIIGRRRRIKLDDALYRMGEPFTNLYAIRVGHFKTSQTNSIGQQHITGFQMAGELLGMDAIGSNAHHCEAIALEDSEVCEIPFNSLEHLFGEVPTLLSHFHRIMSREINREQNVMLLLGSMRADQKFAAFLVNLSSRYAARGYSATRFQLRMSREEIGGYLGLTIESVSRLLSKFKKLELLSVDQRDIELLQLLTLKSIAAGTDHCA